MLKKRFIMVMTLTLSTLCSIFWANVNVSEATPVFRVYVNPSVLGPYDIGTTFDFTIEIEDVPELFCWEFRISWDPSILEWGGTFMKGDFLSSAGDTFFWPDLSDVASGTVKGSETLLGTSEAVGSGTLVTLSLTVIAIGESSIALSEDIFITLSPGPSYEIIIYPPEDYNLEDGYFSNIGPGFSLSAFPSSVTIQQGDSAISTINVTSLEGFSDTVNLSVSNVPSGVTATFDPTQGTPPPDGSATSTLTIQVDLEVAPGSYILTVMGTSGSLQRGVHVTLEVIERPPPYASFSYSPIEPQVGEIVTFDASASYDPDGTIVGYEWEFGDETTGAGMIIDHTYTTAGTYAVTLTVIDNEELTGTSTKIITIAKLSSSISISVSEAAIYVIQNTTISGSITPTRVGVPLAIWHRLSEEETWDVLIEVTADENSEYSYTWTPSEAGTYEIRVSWLGDVNTLPAESSIVIVDVIPLPKLSIKLSGELDYLPMEPVKIRLAALVKDAETDEPVSDANVTIQIYDPDGNLWVSDTMTETVVETGIYEWQSGSTIRELRISEKGVYLVHVQASYLGGPTTSDILEFHIDPQAEDSFSFPMYYYAIASMVLIGVIVLILKRRTIHSGFHRKVQ